MELVLDRKLSERRIFPAIDLKRSGTRKEELLFNADEMELMWNLRNTFSDYNSVETMQMMIDTMKKTKSNEDLLRAAPIIFGKREPSRKNGSKYYE